MKKKQLFVKRLIMSNTLKKKNPPLSNAKKHLLNEKWKNWWETFQEKTQTSHEKKIELYFKWEKHWPSQEEKDTLPTKQKSLIPEEKDTQSSHIKKSLIQKKNTTRLRENKRNSTFSLSEKMRKSSSTPSRQEIFNSLRKHLKLNPLIRKNSTRSRQKQLISLSSEKLNPLDRRKMWTAHPLIQHVQMRTVCQHMHSTVWYLITRTRVAQERTAQDCTHWYLKNHLSSTRHVSFLATPDTWPPAQVFSLSPASSVFQPFFLTQFCPLLLDPYLPCDDSRRSGGSTEIPSPTGCEPKLIQSNRPWANWAELSLTGILGSRSTSPAHPGKHCGRWLSKSCHWRSGRIWTSWCRDALQFNQRCTPIIAYSDLEDGDLRKCWLHRCIFTDEVKMLILLEDPRLQGNQKQR